jgi:hypothetical protein
MKQFDRALDYARQAVAIAHSIDARADNPDDIVEHALSRISEPGSGTRLEAMIPCAGEENR